MYLCLIFSKILFLMNNTIHINLKMLSLRNLFTSKEVRFLCVHARWAKDNIREKCDTFYSSPPTYPFALIFFHLHRRLLDFKDTNEFLSPDDDYVPSAISRISFICLFIWLRRRRIPKDDKKRMRADRRSIYQPGVSRGGRWRVGGWMGCVV